MTVLRCWWLAEFSVPSASFAAALDAAAAETPITDQVPDERLLTVTSESGKSSRGERKERGPKWRRWRHLYIVLDDQVSVRGRVTKYTYAHVCVFV